MKRLLFLLKNQYYFFWITILCSVWMSCSTYAFGVSENEKQEVKAIQDQLTHVYLDNNEVALGMRILEEKILDSKIEVMTIEDNIAEYDSDIAVLQEKINVLFQQISTPKREIAALQAEKLDLLNGLRSEGQKMVMVYLELGTLSLDNSQSYSGAEKLFADIFSTGDAQIFDDITEQSLKEIELETKEKYLEMLYRWQLAESKEKEIRASILEKDETYQTLSLERDRIQQQKEFSQELLYQAQIEKEEYDELLTVSRQQMMQSMVDALGADAKLLELNQKLVEIEESRFLNDRNAAQQNALALSDIKIKDEYTPEELEEMGVATIDLKLLQEANGINISAPLSWPVFPKKGISASFRDSEYYTRFKMQHNAIDIPVPQGTDLKAAADGYVYKAIDNGLGYSYIILLHRNNLRTVYGHVSHIAVVPGQMIQKGEVIGKTGGAPGTKGAGKMTTGPHLHFEVLENEIYKDPIEFLEAGIL